jgi:hypothetical protein
MADEHSVKMIEAALALLEGERNKFLDRQAQHSDKRRALAFDAHAGDAEPSKLLDQLQREAVEIQTQIDGISDAIAEGQRRLVLARAREQEEQNAIKAEALRKVLGRFTVAGRELENALMTLVRSSREMRNALNDLHAGGIHNPRHEVVDGLGYRALATALRQCIWANHFRPLGHDDRRNFADLIASWSAAIEHAITAQLGERTDEAA